MEMTPLTQIFFASVLDFQENEETLNAVNWLSTLQDITLERIISYSEMFFKDQNTEGLGDDSDIQFEVIDYLTLCLFIAEQEAGGVELDEQTKENALVGLSIFAICEKLRRKEILNFVGSGKVIDFNEGITNIELTTTGDVIGSSMKTLMQISDAIESGE
jgi:hypothetical protein